MYTWITKHGYNHLDNVFKFYLRILDATNISTPSNGKLESMSWNKSSVISHIALLTLSLGLFLNISLFRFKDFDLKKVNDSPVPISGLSELSIHPPAFISNSNPALLSPFYPTRVINSPGIILRIMPHIPTLR